MQVVSLLIISSFCKVRWSCGVRRDVVGATSTQQGRYACASEAAAPHPTVLVTYSAESSIRTTASMSVCQTQVT